MNAEGVFVDTNVLLYLYDDDPAKAQRVADVLLLRPLISVQVLNEFANVSLRKLSMTWPDIRKALYHIRSVCPVLPLTVETHGRGVELASLHKLAVYDAMIVAAAEAGGCDVLFSEDMQHGRRIAGLRIADPFRRD